MSRPDTPFEAASYDLKQFRERRMSERRATQRDTGDRRMQHNRNDDVRAPNAPGVLQPPVSE